MKTIATAALCSMILAAPATAATMTFSGVNGKVTQATYTEDGITATSIDGDFWGYPDGGQLHLDPDGYQNSTYDFTFAGGLFTLASLDVSFASDSALGTFTAYDAADQIVGSASFSGATTGARTFSLTNISRLRLVNTGSHMSIDNLTVNAAGAVPEPATWAMMVAGFGVAGAALRRRSRATVRVMA
ncbi:hypothetical protein F4693_003201 [Sphingomonas endophytica]|uniref:Ice-binding protein C-terminal domain-containing protein n=1 Tax=Sphingomonas endophytica TaxID=869719 RepID=A0A7X0JES0_9SPHN|nr:PEPxxWA-CTERM sorting domain-containing protein [Sphingomonas endophytica]MBB6506204.1 hypothetical protein [Sphingomonas endophytica]